VQAGKRDKRITLQQATETQDNAGQPIPGWADLFEVAAEVVYVAGGEVFRGQQLVAKAEVVFEILCPKTYLDDVTPGQRIRISYGGRTYDIARVDAIGNHGSERRSAARRIQAWVRTE